MLIVAAWPPPEPLAKCRYGKSTQLAILICFEKRYNSEYGPLAYPYKLNNRSIGETHEDCLLYPGHSLITPPPESEERSTCSAQKAKAIQIQVEFESASAKLRYLKTLSCSDFLNH